MLSIASDIQVLLANLPLVLLFFLPVSLVMGGIAALYAFLLGRIKNKLISYVIPFAVIVIWSLWAAAQEIPGPMLAVYNYSYMLLFYPMIVVSLLPLANYFIKLEKSWILALVVGTAFMLVSLTLGGLRGEPIATIPAIPPTYVDSLIKIAVSSLSPMGYVLAGYAIVAIIMVAHDMMRKNHGRF